MFRTIAIAALLATTSAVSIRSKVTAATTIKTTTKQGGPPSWDEVLEMVDADGSGTVSWPELKGFFEDLAAEHDYPLSQEELDGLKGFFDMIDADGSGEVDKAEFDAAVAEEPENGLGQKMTKKLSQIKQGPPSWEEILEVLDEDKNGMVSWAEIENFIAQIEKEHGVTIPEEDKKQIKQVFDMVDADGSGEIDKAEFEAAVSDAGALGQKSRKTFKKLSQMKSRQGPPSWEEILEVLDQDKNGMVSWAEIESFIAQIEKEHNVTIPEEDKKQIKQVFDMVDSDGSGEIDKAEFEAAVADAGALGQKSRKTFKKLSQMKSKAKQGGPPSWEDVLEVLDTDKSSTVSWEEVTNFIKAIEKEHNVKISKEDKQAIKAGFDAVDADGNGEIDKVEFEAAVAAAGGLAQLKKYM